MNTPLSQVEERELVDHFISSLASLPRDLLVNLDFTSSLRDVLLAIDIAEKLGQKIATVDEHRRLQEGVGNADRLGKFMRGEEISVAEKLALTQLYVDLGLDIRHIAEVITDHQDAIHLNDLSQFNVCSIEQGCSGPMAVELLTLKDPEKFEHMANLAGWIVERIRSVE